tara:strand:- start:81 stop:200 length:120 start_codon:yes stop_codon:yes gene_type:complete
MAHAGQLLGQDHPAGQLLAKLQSITTTVQNVVVLLKSGE